MRTHQQRGRRKVIFPSRRASIAPAISRTARRTMATEAAQPLRNVAPPPSSSPSPGGPPAVIPSMHTSHPAIQDPIGSQSSVLQSETVDECLAFLTGEELRGGTNAHGLPRLDRERHARFLHRQVGRLPGQFMAADASRPWIFYWSLGGLALLGEDVAGYREALAGTVRSVQNPTGGFGGGPGQTSHLATTYATMLALTLVGGDEAYEVVDRRSMWKWLCSLKQRDGGFTMAIGGEEDVRGAYCAAVIISLLNLPLDLLPDSPARRGGHNTLFDGLGEWIGKCQTYEGGVSAKPGTEAHGAYAFCALGCLSILDSPHKSIPRHVNVPRLISWLSSRQYAPEGGFSGRTNKLVDGCYSHWVGGCWPLIEASLSGPQDAAAAGWQQGHQQGQQQAESQNLFSRDALIRYILCCCQDTSKRGGMRDKPSKNSDAYHTNYVLAGLSSAQHKWTLVSARSESAAQDGDVWVVSPYAGVEQIFDEVDRVSPIHPVYAIPQSKIDGVKHYFATKTGF